MTRRHATITQADVARAIRAAMQAGASAIEVRPDGSIFIRLIPLNTEPTGTDIETDREIVL